MPSVVLEVRLLSWVRERSWYSIGWVTSRSTSSALAPGHITSTLALVGSWGGFNCTLSWRTPQNPTRINMIISRFEASGCRVKVSIR